jgi:hypothetical protein
LRGWTVDGCDSVQVRQRYQVVGGDGHVAAGAVDRILHRTWARPRGDLGAEIRPEKALFNASHSWLIGDRRPFAQTLAFAAGAILILAGVALWAHGGWCRPTAVVGLAVSTVLLLLYFNPWYLFILAVNTALIVGIAGMDWPARSTVGA